MENDLSRTFLRDLHYELEKRIGEVSNVIPVIRMSSEEVDFRKRGRWLPTLMLELEKGLASAKRG